MLLISFQEILLLGGCDAVLGSLDDICMGDAKLLVQGGGRGRGTKRVNADVLASPADEPVPAKRGGGLH